jgi:hypothetical protein
VKFSVTALAALACGAAPLAIADDDPTMSKAQSELRIGCAQSLASFIAHQPAGNAPEYKGEKTPSDPMRYPDAKPCSEAQLAAYLERADPALVMQAYPTAAGRPKARPPADGASAPK